MMPMSSPTGAGAAWVAAVAAGAVLAGAAAAGGAAVGAARAPPVAGGVALGLQAASATPSAPPSATSRLARVKAAATGQGGMLLLSSTGRRQGAMAALTGYSPGISPPIARTACSA